MFVTPDVWREKFGRHAEQTPIENKETNMTQLVRPKNTQELIHAVFDELGLVSAYLRLSETNQNNSTNKQRALSSLECVVDLVGIIKENIEKGEVEL